MENKNYKNETEVKKEEIVSWEYVDGENVPLQIIKLESEKGESYTVGFMNNIVTERKFKTKEDAIQYIREGSWEMVCTMMYAMANKVIDIRENEKLINKKENK